jgi:hypothetical protein
MNDEAFSTDSRLELSSWMNDEAGFRKKLKAVMMILTFSDLLDRFHSGNGFLG